MGLPFILRKCSIEYLCTTFFEVGISPKTIIASAVENAREFLDETNGWSIKYDDVEKGQILVMKY